MATIKSYTDINQSRKLAEILPLESADMYYSKYDNIHANTLYGSCDNQDFNIREYIPCWSLAVLLDVLPNDKHISTTLSRGGWKIEPSEYVNTWWCEYEDENDYTRNITVSANNPIDACYEMIIRLNELKIL